MINNRKKKAAKNLALIKYEHNRELVPVHPHVPEVEKKQPRIRTQLAKLNQPLSGKTFIMSHLILLLISLVFLAGMYFVLNKDSYTQSFVNEYIPVTMKPASFTLELKNPEDESLVATKSVVISGKTAPKASVVVAVDGVASVFSGTEADANGNFQLSVSLANGLNLLEITAFDREGNSKTLSRSIYYSEEQL